MATLLSESMPAAGTSRAPLRAAASAAVRVAPTATLLGADVASGVAGGTAADSSCMISAGPMSSLVSLMKADSDFATASTSSMNACCCLRSAAMRASKVSATSFVVNSGKPISSSLDA